LQLKVKKAEPGIYQVRIPQHIKPMLDSMHMPTIWTIGHSNRSTEDFLKLLLANGIQAVADVRRFPGSRRYPQFGLDALSASLADSHIEYKHFPELGGRRSPRGNSVNTAWRHPAFRGYADYMQANEFKDGIERFLVLAGGKRTAIMCAEVLWWQCHRGLIADYFKASGFSVIHILGANKTQKHPFTSAARLVKGTLNYSADQEQLAL
jgi:uncharacterized protein (DUF488 family)